MHAFRAPPTRVTLHRVIIGILSDTHDRADAMAAAIRTLQDARAEFFAHCGDVGDEGCIDLLAGLPAAFVFGNNDWDRQRLARYAEKLGVACYGNYANLDLSGTRVAIIHGDDFAMKRKLLAAQEHDYLFLGHTHVRADERHGRTRVINPGALYRAKQKTVAVLDTAGDELAFLTVNV